MSERRDQMQIDLWFHCFSAYPRWNATAVSSKRLDIATSWTVSEESIYFCTQDRLCLLRFRIRSIDLTVNPSCHFHVSLSEEKKTSIVCRISNLTQIEYWCESSFSSSSNEFRSALMKSRVSSCWYFLRIVVSKIVEEILWCQCGMFNTNVL